MASAPASASEWLAVGSGSARNWLLEVVRGASSDALQGATGFFLGFLSGFGAGGSDARPKEAYNALLDEVGELEAEEPQHAATHARVRAELEALAAAAAPGDPAAHVEVLLAAAFYDQRELVHARAAAELVPAGMHHGTLDGLPVLAGGRLRPAPVGLASGNRAGLINMDFPRVWGEILAAGFEEAGPEEELVFASGYITGSLGANSLYPSDSVPADV